MITLRDHLEIQRNNTSEGSVDKWIENMPEEEKYSWLIKMQSGYPLGKPVKPDGVYEHIDVEKMIYGQFMMIEMVLNSEKPYYEKLRGVLHLILRPSSGKFDNEDKSIEESFQSLIDSMGAAYAEDVFNRFLKARDHVIHEKYAGSIYSTESVSEIVGEDEDEVVSSTMDDAESKLNQNWYFYVIAKSFVNDDITRLSEAYELSMSTVLPELSYRSQKNKIEETKARFEKTAASFRK